MVAHDPYKVLGIAKSADSEAIKKAYRALVKEYHPDLHPNDPDIERKFKEISAAYELLRDKNKKAQYDRGEIDAEGKPSPFGGGGWQRSSKRTKRGFGSSFFDDFFQQGGASVRSKGANVSYTLHISFAEAVLGGNKRITLSDDNQIDLKIPPGVEDHQTLRVKGKGMPGMGGGPAGDALIELMVDPHPFFTREGKDLHIEIPVTLKEAVLGDNITVPTINGKVTVKVPPNSSSGTSLRLRGKGVRTATPGDQYIKLKIILPEEEDPNLATFIKKWKPKASQNPRKKFAL